MNPLKSFKSFKNLTSSIYTKLLLVFIASGVLINIVVVAFFARSWIKSQEVPLKRHLLQYAHYIIQDLGTPPSEKHARKLSQKLDMEFRFESPTLTWSTSDEIPSLAEIQLEKEEHFDEDEYEAEYELKYDEETQKQKEYFPIRFGGYQEKRAMIIETKQGTYLFRADYRPPRERFFQDGFLFLLGSISVIIVLAYFFIRRTFKPIRLLSEAARQVGEGNLSHRVGVKTKDELGQLAETFNHMTSQVGGMIKAREQLLLDVSHELRSPLTRMKVAFEFLPESKALKGLKEDAVEMETMITEILETARLGSQHGSLDIQPENLSELLQKALHPLAETSPGIVCHSIPEDLQILVDREQFHLVLKNLFQNALKYSKPSSKSVVVNVREEKEGVILQIQDDGIGIPPEEISFIFEPFYRIDKSRSKKTGGYGLGLNLCKTIIEAHQGKIEANSTGHDGTTMTLFLKGASS